MPSAKADRSPSPLLLSGHKLKLAVGFFLPMNWRRKAPGQPDSDRLWATAQDLDVPLAIHPTIEPLELDVHKRYDDLKANEPFTYTWYLSVLAAQGMQQAFVSLFNYGVVERFPQVKAVVLESQASWIGYLLDRYGKASQKGHTNPRP